jgi:MFS family permease
VVFGGFFNSIVNVILLSSVQLTTPDDVRGKVMAFMSMITQGLTPFAMALGGVLATYMPINLIVTISFIITFLLITPFWFVKPFIRFINFDTEKDTVEGLLEESVK